MNAAKVKELLSEQDIFSLLEELGSEPEWKGLITARTRCHNPAHEGKHKLVYYPDSKTFHCYTGCGSMDIFGLIQKIFELDFFGSYKYICSKFGIDMSNRDYSSPDIIDKSFFEKFKKREEKVKLNYINKDILNSWLPMYHQLWLDDGISIASMKKFNIRFSILNNQIIIPHCDEKNNLVGIRSRNLNQQLVDEGKKYMPVYYKNKSYKHPTGSCLYGLNINKKDIEKAKTVIIFESEKSVLQLDTMFPNNSIGVCISGSNITNHQLEILKELDIDEVVIALDKEFDEIGSDKEKFYAKKIKETFVPKLTPYFKTSIIWDTDSLIDEKDSPTDKGKETFEQLFSQRIFL